MSTVLGSASVCTRAATFGVSPKTAPSWETTTRPVCIPTRTASRMPCSASSRSLSTVTASIGREACAHGTLGVVAVGLRPAEVGEEPVAEVLRHVAAEAPDDLGGALLVRLHHFAPLLGIEARRELR